MLAFQLLFLVLLILSVPQYLQLLIDRIALRKHSLSAILS
ncbi:hypothetical protein HMPREF1112_0292 [Streptococcus pseudopneumoniae SK674]|nr:hypothetical protein HMPREF1112_0292 [Streptococcus pseudopneumoniae SK674]